MNEIAEYWIGEDVDYSKLWNAYNSGKDDYTRKFNSMNVVPIRIEFEFPHPQEPLFNLEVIYKTLKGLYFDFKQYCIIDITERDKAGPLFVQSIERGSADWTILVEAAYAAPFVLLFAKAFITCAEAYHEIYKIKKTKLECEVLEHQVEEINKAREKDNKDKIEPANIDKLIQDKKVIFENLISQQIKQISISGIFVRQIVINFESPEAENKNPEPPRRG